MWEGEQKPDLNVAYKNCNGTDRNLYMTITRVKVDSTSSFKKSELAEEARVMEAANQPPVGLTLFFTNFPGEVTSSALNRLAFSLFALAALAFATLF